MLTEVVKSSLKKKVQWLTGKSTTWRPRPWRFFFSFLSDEKQTKTSATPKSIKRWILKVLSYRAENILSASMTWLVVNRRLCPWHRSLRVKNCAPRAKKTRISHQHWYFFFLKKGKKKKNLTHPMFISEYIDYFGSTTVAQNTSVVVFFFCLFLFLLLDDKWH